MGFSDLGSFLHALEARGELTRISAAVSPALEITEITDRVSKQGGKALLFERVEGSPYPLLINAFGSEARLCLALGAGSLESLSREIGAYLDFDRYLSLGGILSSVPMLLRLLQSLPRHRLLPFPPCRQVVEKNPDLDTLPILKCWPGDGGKFLTLPLVFTRPPDKKNQNAGVYRMQVLDKTTAALHWHKHKDGDRIYEAWRQKGGRMPVSVALGCSPAAVYAATAPLPPDVDEMLLAGFLQRRPVRLTKCLSNGLYVPEDAQFVLEGYVDAREPPVTEGPFGDHTGYYSLPGLYPRFHITCLTRRRNPVYQATVVGKPPMEDCYLAKATERLFLPFLKLLIPELTDLNLPLSGVFHNCAVLSVRQAYPGAARTAMHALWGLGQMRYTKLLIAVDPSVNPRDPDAVLEAILRFVRPEKDLIFSQGPLDALDHASPLPLYGTRLGVDATKKPDAPVSHGGFIAMNIKKSAPGDGRRAAERALLETDAKIAAILDGDVDIRSRPDVFWRIFNHIDAARDLVIKFGRVGIDATRKLPEELSGRPWPQDIEMSREIKERVSRRWKEYGIE